MKIIDLMSNLKGSSYEDYVQNLIDSENVQAMMVKLAAPQGGQSPQASSKCQK
jgi:hypothetical protein